MTTPTQKKAPKPRPRAVTERSRLLAILRAESEALIADFHRTGVKPVCHTGLLAELARAATHCHRKSFHWRGVRFPLLCGFSLQILDPDTHKPLVSTGGGLVC